MGLDAVRLLTIHASKGLEFTAVYLPGLGQRYFPVPWRGQICPPPTGMVAHEARDWHAEEEECLFFVALSRARDVLCLSRANRYGSQNSAPSSLLSLVAAQLPHPPLGSITWPGSEVGPEAAIPLPPPLEPPSFPADELDVYINCPRKYYYEFILGLGGRREDSAYVQFHRCVYDVLRWLQAERVQGREVNVAVRQQRLAEAWEKRGLKSHAYEAIYWQAATAIVARVVTRSGQSSGVFVQPEWKIPLAHGHVSFKPDHVEISPDGSAPPVVRRWRTGRPSKSETEKNVYALYQEGSRRAYPEAGTRVELVYLSSDHVERVELGAKTIATRLGRYDDAIVGILQAEFPHRPNDRECPRCSHYFICPVAEDEAN